MTSLADVTAMLLAQVAQQPEVGAHVHLGFENDVAGFQRGKEGNGHTDDRAVLGGVIRAIRQELRVAGLRHGNIHRLGGTYPVELHHGRAEGVGDLERRKNAASEHFCLCVCKRDGHR